MSTKERNIALYYDAGLEYIDQFGTFLEVWLRAAQSAVVW